MDHTKIDFKFVTVENFPSYVLSYLVNSDPNGCGIEDIENCDRYIKENIGLFDNVSVDDNSYNEFSSHPAFGLACSTYTVTFACLRMHYKVTFRWYESQTFCSNIAYGTVREITDHYSKYCRLSDITLKACSDEDVSYAKEKGMPYTDCSKRS